MATILLHIYLVNHPFTLSYALVIVSIEFTLEWK